MPTVVVYDRKNTKCLETEADKTETLLSIKEKLCHSDPESLQVSFEGEILSDSTQLSELGDYVVLILENDIEFTDINKEEAIEKEERLSETEILNLGITEDEEEREIVLNGRKMKVKSSDLFSSNGKTYYVTSRRKRVSLRSLFETARNGVSIHSLLQLLPLFFIIYTNNLFLLILILVIRSLRNISKFFVSWELWKGFRQHVLKSVFLFVASMFLIDFRSFYA